MSLSAIHPVGDGKAGAGAAAPSERVTPFLPRERTIGGGSRLRRGSSDPQRQGSTPVGQAALMSPRRKLPIGIQTFRTLREEGCHYVDKTACVGRLLEEGAHYFLSRPRRFGKSLFLDTLKEFFEGDEALKVVELEPAGEAMAQLKEKRYADKYRHPGQPIHRIAVEFSKEARNLAAFEVERAT